MKISDYKKMAPKANKYRAKKTATSDGGTADSKKEAARYEVLVHWQKMGLISELQRQVPYPLSVNGVLIATYVADHTFLLDGRLVVEDVKGMKKGSPWQMFRLKAKLMLAIHGITVEVV